jgi:hypothetical protein
MWNRGVFLIVAAFLLAPIPASAVLFDFDNAPAHSPLPIDITVGGITAHLSACSYNYSIQEAGVMGFTPAGFSGNCVYPSSVYLCDLYISYSVALTDFSIMFAPEEYGCDTTARIRVTAYSNGTYVGTNTAQADSAGTWPTGTLSFHSAAGFNSVVVHYDAPPPFGCDWGPIFMADNMNVTVLPVNSVDAPIASGGIAAVSSPNPFSEQTIIRFRLEAAAPVTVAIYGVAGELVRTIESDNPREAGEQILAWDGRDDHGRGVRSGIYLCRVIAGGRASTTRLLLLRTSS